MNVAFVPQRHHLLQGRVFNFGPEYGERKSVFGESYTYLRQRLDSKGHKFDTIDRFSLDEIDICLFEDMNYEYLYRLLTETETPRLVYIMQAPPSIYPDHILSNFVRLVPLFDSILTWNDSLVEAYERFSKHHIPQYTEQKQVETLNFDQQQLLVNISSRKYSPTKHPEELYTKREEIIKFYEENHPSDFTLHGHHWNQRPRLIDTYHHQVVRPTNYSVYEGSIDKKTDAYRDHRFALSFENMTGIDGYISEKIFDCLRSGIVPVYWGATNVSAYVPSDAFIDYREYGTPTSLHEYLTTVTAQEHAEFVRNAQQYLQEDASHFSIQGYAKRIEKQILAEKGRHQPPDESLLQEIKVLSRVEKLVHHRDKIDRIRYMTEFLKLFKNHPEALSRFPTTYYHLMNKVLSR